MGQDVKLEDRILASEMKFFELFTKYIDLNKSNPPIIFRMDNSWSVRNNKTGDCSYFWINSQGELWVQYLDNSWKKQRLTRYI
jgi:hypothetical protein